MAVNLGTSTKCIERTELIESFLKDIRKYPTLSAEEEAHLFEIYNQAKELGEKDVMSYTKMKIINGNARFLYAVAKKYANQDNISDLINEGFLGMEEAFESFDVTTGNRFCSYASWYIRRQINFYLINENNMVKKSNRAKYGAKIKKIKNKFFNEQGRYPVESELMDILNEEYGEDIKNVKDLYDLQVTSINEVAPSDGDDREYNYEDHSNFSLYTATENEAVKEENDDYNKTVINALLSCLKERDRDIVKKLFGIDCTQMSSDDLAEEYNMTNERIRQIKKAALKRMKEVQVSHMSI